MLCFFLSTKIAHPTPKQTSAGLSLIVFIKRLIRKKEAIPAAADCNKFEFEVIVVAYTRFGGLKVFVQSWINQTEKNWKLHVIHDGDSKNFIK